MYNNAFCRKSLKSNLVPNDIQLQFSGMQANILASYKPVINLTLLIPSLKSMEDSMIGAQQSFNSTRNIIVYYEDLLDRKEVCNHQNSLSESFRVYINMSLMITLDTVISVACLSRLSLVQV